MIMTPKFSPAIRLATKEDASAIREIYAPYVLDTAITFEYDVPSVEEFEKRIENTLKNYPYFVAEDESGIVGYAYASQFRTRAAYIHGAELSIYIKNDYHKKGLGRMLYTELAKCLSKQNVFVMYGAIAATSRNDDEHLTDASIKFHEKMGFKLTAKHENCGIKFGKWYDIVWMEKRLSEPVENPPAFIPFPEISLSLLQDRRHRSKNL